MRRCTGFDTFLRYGLLSLLVTTLTAEEIKDSLRVAGTCGNGLICKPQNGEEVDCFMTLLTSRCIYGFGSEFFIIFIAALVVLFVIMVVCILWLNYQSSLINSCKRSRRNITYISQVDCED